MTKPLQVALHAADGRFVSEQKMSAATSWPISLACVPRTEQVLVVEYTGHAVVLLPSLTDSTIVRTYGRGMGSGPGQLQYPKCVAYVSAADVRFDPVRLLVSLFFSTIRYIA
jgi:hypothetical protein